MNPHHIYEEMIKSTRHVKIEETKWATMDDFLNHLKISGKALYKMTETGPTVRHGAPPPKIVPTTITLTDEQDFRKVIKNQIKGAEKAESKDKKFVFQKPLPIDRSKSEKVAFSLGGAGDAKTNTSLKRKLTGTAKLKVQKKPKNMRQGWLEEGLVVKCLNKIIGNGKYYKKKGVVTPIRDPNAKDVQIRMQDDDTLLVVSLKELETVLPALNKEVKIVNLESEFLGQTAKLISLQEDTYSATVKMLTGHKKGETISGIEYQHICKFVPSE